MATIKVPEGARQMTLPSGQILQIPQGATTVNIPDNLIGQVQTMEAPPAPFTEINGQLVERQFEQPRETTIGENIIGGVETAASLASGATAGAAGQILGTVTQLSDEILSGEFGTPQAAKRVQETAERFGQSVTYEPRTEAGQSQLKAIAKPLGELAALTPATAEIAGVTQSIKNIAPKTTPIPKVETPIPKQPQNIEGIAEMSVKAAQGSKKAKQQLAEEVQINPDVLNAAERLGIDLPADVLSDNTLVKQTAGLVRSQIGEESAKFADIVTSITNKADDIIDELGRTDIATASSKILNDLDSNIKQLQKESEAIYNKVNKEVPKNTPVQLVNSLETMNKITDELGGTKNLTREERQLVNLVKNDNVTYEALQRERRLVGRALGSMPDGKYANADKSLLSRVYASLKSDQLDNIEAIAGTEARDKLHLADRTFQKKIALEKRVAENFGKEGEGSISNLLTRAITQGSKGDITALNKALRAVPKNLKKETFISALANASTSKRGSDFGRFDFNSYSKLYEGLVKNRPVYNEVIKAIGKDKQKILNDLFIVSKRVSEAKSNLVSTGKANQQILGKIQEEALLQRIIKFTVEKGVRQSTFGQISPNLEGLFKTSKDKLSAVGELIRSQDFKDLAIEAIGANPSQKTVNKFINSKKFKDWSKAIGSQIKNPEAWIYESLTQTDKEQ